MCLGELAVHVGLASVTSPACVLLGTLVVTIRMASLGFRIATVASWQWDTLHGRWFLKEAKP